MPPLRPQPPHLRPASALRNRYGIGCRANIQRWGLRIGVSNLGKSDYLRHMNTIPTVPPPHLLSFVNWVKRAAFVFWFLALMHSSAFAKETITTRSGKTYRESIVTQVTPTGLFVVHNWGEDLIPFEDLPDALQKKYHYDTVLARDTPEYAARKAFETYKEEWEKEDQRSKAFARQFMVDCEKERQNTKALETKARVEKVAADKIALDKRERDLVAREEALNRRVAGTAINDAKISHGSEVDSDQTFESLSTGGFTPNLITLLRELNNTHANKVKQRRLKREEEYNDPLNKLKREVDAARAEADSASRDAQQAKAEALRLKTFGY